MDGFTLLVIIVLLLLFGKGSLASLTAAFNQPNAVPTPYGLPADTVSTPSGPTTQDQNNLSTANAPAPWTSGNSCQAGGIALPRFPVSGAPKQSIVGVNPISQSLPMGTQSGITRYVQRS